MTQNLFDDFTGVFEMPAQVDAVEVVQVDAEKYQIQYITKAGIFVIVNFTNARKRRFYKSLDRALMKVKEMGWDGNVLLRFKS